MVNKINTRSISALITLSTAFSFIILFLADSRAAQTFNQDPGHKEYVVVNGIRISCPDEFTPQRQQPGEQFIYMRHDKYDLGLVAAVPDKPIDEAYVKELAPLVASYLFPKEKAAYSWKALEGYERVSKFEIGGGMIQGFNGKQRVLLQLRVIRVKQKMFWWDTRSG